MKNFYLYIFILLSFIFAVSYFNTYLNTFKESFNSNKQNFILLGDSILNNKAYIPHRNSIGDLLIERTDKKTICLAVDNSKINDIYSQIDKIPDNLNNNYTTIFLSAGGNDILNYYVEQENKTEDTSFLTVMFDSYKNLIKSIQTKIPDANIVLLDVYYPKKDTYLKYHSIINEWNSKIYNFAKINNYSVLKISNFLTSDEDFSFGIEPSIIGSKKLVDTILNM